ncbi:MAG: family 10 glycosylhydrolase [Silvanigrellaceae bacterium]
MARKRLISKASLGLFVMTAFLGLEACKKQQTTESETEAASSKSSIVTGFVTREHGYLDTTTGRKHVMSMASRIGLKRVFVDVWSRGCTLFKSNVMKAYGGPEVCAESEGDPLAELIRYGKSYNVEVVPWFEWGNIVPVKSALWNRNKSRGWAGFEESFHTVPSIRINPYKGDFDDFYAALMKEVVSKYGAREIHICDNFAPHTKYGPATAIKGPVAFTAFAKKVMQPARSAGARVSLSSQRRLNSLQTFSIDWQQWLNSGVVDWVYPQLYHVAENKTDQFMNEAKAERGYGAVGVALYSGPSTERWTLDGLGRLIKLARSLGMESAIFDFNSLLSDLKASKNADVEKISAAFGTRIRNELPGASSSQPQSAPAQQTPPPAPQLPPPDTSAPAPIATAAATAAPASGGENSAPTGDGSSTNSSPVVKTRLCEYMKIAGAPDTGAPTFLSTVNSDPVDSAPNGQLAYRHLTQLNINGELMMYVTLYSADGSVQVRWVQARYLAERRPDELTCAP